MYTESSKTHGTNFNSRYINAQNNNFHNNKQRSKMSSYSRYQILKIKGLSRKSAYFPHYLKSANSGSINGHLLSVNTVK